MIKSILRTFSDSYLFVDVKNSKNNLRYKDFEQLVQEEVSYLNSLENNFFIYPLSEDPRNYNIALCASLFSKKTLLPSLAPYPEINNFKLYQSPKRDQKPTPFPIAEEDGELPFLALRTSGSSGEAKIFCFHLNNLISSAEASISFYQMKKNERHLLHLPLHHIGGNMVFWRAFLSGGCLYYNDPNLEGDYDYLSLVPLQLRRLLDKPKLKNFKAIILGGEKCPQDLIFSIQDKKLPVSLTYGLTETCAQVTATVPGKVEYESVGTVLQNRLVTLEKGRVCIESRANPQYLIKEGKLSPLSSSKVLSEDLGEFKDNQLFVHARVDQVFISGGENISPQEIESILSAEMDLIFKKILPVFDATFGQVPALFYQGNFPPEEIYQKLKQKLPNYKLPKYLLNLKNLNPQGLKFSQAELREYFKVTSEKKELDLFIHGFLGEATDFAFFENSKSMSLELPGHGSYKKFSFETQEEYLEILIKAYRLNSFQKIHLCGYSQGGRIALGLASKLPNVAKLTLIAAHPGLTSEDEKNARWKSDQLLFKGRDLKAFLNYWYAQGLFSLSESQQKEVIKKRQNNDLLSIQNSMKLFSLGLQTSYWELLQKFKGELHYIYGEKDLKFKKLAEEIKALNTNCQVHEIAGAGHNPLLFHQKEILSLKI